MRMMYLPLNKTEYKKRTSPDRLEDIWSPKQSKKRNPGLKVNIPITYVLTQ